MTGYCTIEILEEPSNQNTMKKICSTIVIAFISAASATAQTTPAAPNNKVSVNDECLLATDAVEWTAIGLTSDQVKRVQGIQTDCKTDCAVISETGVKDATTSRSALEKHEARIRKVLSLDQYNKWIEWCSQRPMKM